MRYLKVIFICLYIANIYALHFTFKSDLPEDKVKLILDGLGFEYFMKSRVFKDTYHVKKRIEATLPLDVREHLNDFTKLRNIKSIHSLNWHHPLELSKRFVVPRNIKKLLADTYLPDDKRYDNSVREITEGLNQEFKFNDPLARKTWQYMNAGDDPISSSPGLDVNLFRAYQTGYTGMKINILVIDDALDYTHDDIAANFNPNISIDLVDPRRTNPRGTDGFMDENLSHGTAVAGLAVGVANNSKCSFGVAYNAKIGGIRILDGRPTVPLLAEAFLTFMKDVQIYITSWGPNDDGEAVFHMHPMMYDALHSAVTQGNVGKGVSIIAAAGNGGLNDDNCGADGYLNSPFVIVVNAIGEAGMLPAYGEMCPAIVTSVPVAGDYDTIILSIRQLFDRYSMPTTASNNECMTSFIGTSASPPIVAGCLALALEANPELTWRDIQALLIFSSRIPHPTAPYWYVNGAGVLMSPVFGAGLLNCAQLVILAIDWQNIGPLCVKKITTGKRLPVNSQDEDFDENKKHKLTLMKGCSVVYTFVVETSMGSLDSSPDRGIECPLDKVEIVALKAQWSVLRRGNVRIYLESSSSLKVILLDWRSNDDGKGTDEFSWKSVMHFGEDMVGEWKVTFEDIGGKDSSCSDEVVGFIHFLEIQFMGTNEDGGAITRNNRLLKPLVSSISKEAREQHKSHKLSTNEVRMVYDEQRWMALEYKYEKS